MSVTQLVKTIGDRDTPFHRSALAGNAMFFDLNRWVKLTNGTDTIPNISGPNGGQPFTAIISLIYINFTIRIFSSPFNQSRQFPGATNNQYRYLRYHSINRYFSTYDTFSPVVAKRHEAIINRTLNQRHIDIVLSNFSTTRGDFCHNGRLTTGILTINSLSTNTQPFYSEINIGRLPRADGVTEAFGTSGEARNAFAGYMRSLEIIVGRNLNNTELRRTFNIGTAYEAGLITPNDISIDFNRINGQLPICRLGSRQLTVTAYNDTTPDTAGTTYADFYSI